VKPFLLLATRAEDLAAEEEYDAFLRFGRLEPHQLERRRLEREPLGPVDLARYSGVILGGSPFTASVPPDSKSAAQRRVEGELMQLFDVLVPTDFPVLGACYGIGVIGLHQGAVVDGTYGEPVGPTEIELSEDGLSDPLLGVLPRRFEAFVGHKEAVTTLPGSAVCLARSAACPVQAFRVGSNVYATQFHPELDVPGISTRIDIYRDYGYFPPETADGLKATAAASRVEHPPAIVRRFVELYAH
jgi:GMP synthase (glutamine-hydrolysing)